MPRRRRRIGRIALNALTGVSLLLCVGTAVLWVRSYTTSDAIDRSREWIASVPPRQNRHSACLWSKSGHLMLWVLVQHGSDYLPARDEINSAWSHDVVDLRYWGLNRMGCRLEWGLVSGDHQVSYMLAVPHAVVLVGCLITPACLVRLGWHRRSRPGLCPRCRYDLTGNVSGTCPECGTPAADAAAA